MGYAILTGTRESTKSQKATLKTYKNIPAIIQGETIICQVVDRMFAKVKSKCPMWSMPILSASCAAVFITTQSKINDMVMMFMGKDMFLNYCYKSKYQCIVDGSGAL